MFYRKLLFSVLVGLSVTSSLNAKELLGAGATFPYPLYSKMFDEYYKKTGIKVNYQSIGSGGGQKQLQAKTVDFGGSDEFISDEAIKEFKANLVHIPTCLGAVAISYNLPGNPQLQFTPDVLVDIFLGKITNWNDPKIKNLNPKVSLPNMPITVARRSDGSGTTAIFSDYLSKVSQEWATKVGKGKSLNFPVGLGGKGNEGVTAVIKQTPGGIGYIEMIYAVQNKLPMAGIKNLSGKFVIPSLESVSQAAKGDIPSDTRVSITNSKVGYPISGLTWILVYQEQAYNNRSLEEAKSTVKLLKWMITQGQSFSKPLGYAPLPKDAQKKAENLIKTIQFNSKPINMN